MVTQRKIKKVKGIYQIIVLLLACKTGTGERKS